MTQNAFTHFKEWAKGRSFNEILGCAKGHQDGLYIHYDVDEYNNQIAFSFYYYPNGELDAKCTHIEVELCNNGNIVFRDLDATKEKHEEGVSHIKAEIYRLLGLQPKSYNDGEIISYWNDYVSECGEDYDSKLYDMDEENLDTILEDYNTNSIARFILNIDNRFSTTDKFFYITNDYHICTTNNIWDVINEVELYDYINTNVRVEKYGKVWEVSKCYNALNENNQLVCRMDNGDEIWINMDKRYLVLYLEDSDNPYLYYMD